MFFGHSFLSWVPDIKQPFLLVKSQAVAKFEDDIVGWMIPRKYCLHLSTRHPAYIYRLSQGFNESNFFICPVAIHPT